MFCQASHVRVPASRPNIFSSFFLLLLPPPPPPPDATTIIPTHTTNAANAPPPPAPPTPLSTIATTPTTTTTMTITTNPTHTINARPPSTAASTITTPPLTTSNEIHEGSPCVFPHTTECDLEALHTANDIWPRISGPQGGEIFTSILLHHSSLRLAREARAQDGWNPL